MDAFLETTAVVDLLFKDKASRTPISEILKGCDVKYSSQYVRMEIKRGVLQHFVYLHNKAVECDSYADVQTCVTRLSATPMKNKLGTLLKAIEEFYQIFETVKEIPDGRRPAQFMKSMLAAFLRVRINRFWAAFEKLVDVVLDGPECYKRRLVLSAPRLEGKLFDNTLPNCDRFKPVICRIGEFCRDNRDELRAVHDHLVTLTQADAETLKRIQAAKEVLRLPKRDVLQKTCWNMGDLVLVMESPKTALIVTGNGKHYLPMCLAASKKCACY